MSLPRRVLGASARGMMKHMPLILVIAFAAAAGGIMPVGNPVALGAPPASANLSAVSERTIAPAAPGRQEAPLTPAAPRPPVPCTSPPFSDVAINLYWCREIKWMKDNGISTGGATNTYQPTANLTRAAVAAFLARLSGDALVPCASKPFNDVPLNHPFCPEIGWMKDNNIVLAPGFGDNTYRPALAVTRMAMAAFVSRFAGASLISCGTAPFTDIPTSHVFCKEIKWMKDQGVVTGFDDGTYRPSLEVTRMAAAAFVYRLAALLDGAPVVTTSGGDTGYTEGDPATVIDGLLTITDADDTHLVSGQVRLSSGFQSGDVLAFADTAAISGAYNGATGVLTLTGTDTVANYEAALRSITFENTGTTPAPARTVEFRAYDGILNSNAATRDLDITAVNQEPVVTSDGTTPYTEGAAPTVIDSAITVADADDTDLVSATIAITNNFEAGDLLGFTTQNGITGVYTPGTGVLALSGSSSVANYQTALASVTYASGTNYNPSSPKTVSFTVNDGSDDSNTATKGITISAVNDAPDVDNSAGSLVYTENDPATAIDSTITITDPDSADLTGATVQITANYVEGQDILALPAQPIISAIFDAPSGTLTLSGTDTVAAYETALEAVTYVNTSDDPSALARTVTYQASDAGGSGVADTHGITIGADNDAPVVTTTVAELAYTEGDGFVVIDPGLTLTDVDSANISGATIQITANFDPLEDELAFTTIGPISGSWDGPSATLTLSGTDSVADYQAALRTVTYRSTGSAPTMSVAPREISFQATDSSAAPSNLATRDIAVAMANQAPIVTTTGTNTAYTEGGADAIIDAAITVSDADDSDLEGATITISAGLETGDSLNFSTQNGISQVSYTGGLLSLTGTSSVANYQLALRSITFSTSNDNPSASRTIEFKVNDGSVDSNAPTKGITITPTNDGPVVTSDGVTPYTEGAAATVIDSAITVTDPDDSDLESAIIAITTNFQAGDLLGFTTQNGITGVYNGTDGILTLTGTSSVANYQTALASVTYDSGTNNNPTSSKTVSFTVHDGSVYSNLATKTLIVTGENDAPVVTTSGGPTTHTEGGAAAVIDGSITVSDAEDADLEGATVTISAGIETGDSLNFSTQNGITGNYLSGVLTLTGTSSVANYQTALASITFSTTNDNPSASRTIEFKVNDGTADSNAPTKAITITPTNDAPVVTTSGGPTPYTEDDEATVIDSGITVTDADDADLESAIVAITTNFQAGDLLGFSNQNGITGAYTSGTGVLVLSGTASVADYETALASVTYDSGTNDNPMSSKTVSFIVNDGTDNSNVPTRGITITPTNDGPTNTGPASASVNEDTPLNFTGGIAVSVADPDSGAGALQIQLSVTNGTLTMTTLTGLTFSGGSDGAGDAAMTFTGTLANVNNALATLRFDPTLNFPGAAASGIAALSMTSNDQGNTGGGALSDTDGFNITVNQVNDAPIGGGDSAQTVGNVQLFYDLATGGVPGTTKTTGSTNGVLDNDSDPVEGSAVSVAGVAGCGDASAPFDCSTVNGGSITINSNGRFTFRPSPGNTSADSFQYVLTDGTTAQNVNVTVSLTFVGTRIWFVRNDAAGGGLGRSSDPFDTLVEAQTAANAVNDRIFVYVGNGTTSGQNAGFTFAAASQTLQGEAVALFTGATVNGINNASLVAAGSQPLIDNTAGNGVNMGVGSLVTGLSIAGSSNAIDLTRTGASTGTYVVSSNTIRGAGAEGIDINVNAGTTGTVTLALTNNSWNTAGTHTGNAIDINNSSGSANTLNLNVSSNTNITANGNGANISGGAVANTIVTGFTNNSIHGNTAGSGVTVSSVTFDTIPGGGIQFVYGDDLAIGASGDPVGGAGMAITTSQGNILFDDIDIFAASGTALGVMGSGTGLTFGVTPSPGGGSSTLDADNGAAVDISTTTLDLRLADLDSNTAGAGVNLSGVGGIFNAPTGSSITKASGSGTAFAVANSVSSTIVSYAGSINVTSGAGVSLTTNPGSTISFIGALTLSTGANPAFAATGGGTVTATASGSTLATTSGTALNVANTTIGAGGLTFQSISSNGAVNGIVLSTTGALGGLTVAGNGGTCSSAATCTGGAIQNSTNAGIALTTVNGGVSLTRMSINNGGDDGIRATTVLGLLLDKSRVISNGNTHAGGLEERGLDYLNVTGTASITETTVSGSDDTNAYILNTGAGSLTMTVNLSTFSDSKFNTGLRFRGEGVQGTPFELVANVTNSTFSQNADPGFSVQTNPATNVHQTVLFDNNSVSGGSPTNPVAARPQISINIDGASVGKFTISNNEIKSGAGSEIILNTAAAHTGTFDVLVTGNTINDAQPGTLDALADGGSAIHGWAHGDGATRIAISNNTVQNWGGRALELSHNDGNGTADYTVTDNTFNTPDISPNTFEGMYAFTGGVGGDNSNMCIDMDNNDFDGIGRQGVSDLALDRFGTTQLRFAGYNNTTVPGLQTYLRSVNPLSPALTVETFSLGPTATAAATCSAPVGTPLVP